MLPTPIRLLFTGLFNGSDRVAARDALCRLADEGARDILYVTPSADACRAVIADLIARRGAVFGLRAIAISRVPFELARRARVSPPVPIDRVVDSLLIDRAIRAACGRRFSANARMDGLSVQLGSVVRLLEMNGVTAAGLNEVLEKENIRAEGSRLLCDAWKSFELARTGLGITGGAALRWAVSLLDSKPELLANCDVLVLEDLALSTPAERRIVEALISHAPKTVIAAHGYADQMQHAPATIALGHLRAMASWNEMQCGPPGTPYRNGLARLFGKRADHNPGDSTAPEVSITRLEATGEVGEIRLAAAVVRRHLDNGVPPSEIQIVVHSGPRYHDLIHEIFGRAGIPVETKRGQSIAETGIGRTLLRLISIATSKIASTISDSLDLVRTPYIDIGPGATGRLEQMVITTGLLGFEGWDKLSAEILGKHTFDRINRLRKAIATAKEGFGRAASADDAARVARAMAKELRLVGHSFFARRRAAKRAPDESLNGLTDLAIREDNQAWEEIEAALDNTVPALLATATLGKKRAPEFAAEWAAMLERALLVSEVRASRPKANAVWVTGTGPGTDRPSKVTIILGLLERAFPRIARQDPFLKDDARRLLFEKSGWDLPLSENMGEREREAFLRAVSTPSEALYLSCPAVNVEGKPAVKSFFMDDLQRAVGTQHKFAVERSSSVSAATTLTDAATRSSVMAAVSHDIWQHLPADSVKRRESALAGYELLRESGANLSALTDGRRAIQRPHFSDALLADTPYRTLRLSASQLESLGHCTYQHFVKKVLRPNEITTPAYDSLSKGKLIHDAIMHWAVDLRGWTRGVGALPDLHKWFAEQIALWSPAERIEVAEYSAGQDIEALDELLRLELDRTGDAGMAKPLYNELAFGGELQDSAKRDEASRIETFDVALELSRGQTTVHFRGSLDRVDVFEQGGVKYGVILDYKTGATSRYYAKSMLAGENLQLRLYMLALRHFWKIEPAGALFIGLGDGARRGAVRGSLARFIGGIDPDLVELMEDAAWAEFVQVDTVRLIAPIVERLVNLDITPAPRDRNCGFCELQPVCRYDRYAART